MRPERGNDRHARDNGRAPGLAERLTWFVGLWVAGVAVVGAVAFAIRLVLV